ncbi:hypothetical protein BK147_00360 [Paenibacillus sp. FSL R7-0337]|nr:hypothetical protein BK147_00360 [Paenibacillus sp. FSL R7-0337]
MDVNGITLYYEMSGRGLPIVFIHDYSTSHHLFEPQAEFSANARRLSCMINQLLLNYLKDHNAEQCIDELNYYRSQ